jgi:hypothetical protein
LRSYAQSSTGGGVYCPLTVRCGAEEFEEGGGEDREIADCEGDPVLHWMKVERKRSARRLSQIESEKRRGRGRERGEKKIDRDVPLFEKRQYTQRKYDSN